MKKLAVILLAILLALITLFVIDALMTPNNVPLDAENLTPQEYNMAVAAGKVTPCRGQMIQLHDLLQEMKKN